jgi:hypothetical protein
MSSFVICNPKQILFAWTNKEVDEKAYGTYWEEVKYMWGFGAKA